MSRFQILKELKANNHSFSTKQLEVLLDNFFVALEEFIVKGNKIEVRSFGSFFIKQIKEKKGARNPKTGELIFVPKKNKLSFKPGKDLKKFINEK
ncbi:MAG: integration host factor subunit beta [Candidatus Pelagibacter sp.]|nr:integration host factor subunit beta [Candidatus Pelagibacter sp.]OUW24741.1 MAG: hypothetical protein CBD34_00085 [Rickettsiales bacterium TMED174]